MSKAFEINGNKGFHITFASGVTVSVQFGAGNYCDNYKSRDFEQKTGAESNTCEIAVWKEGGDWITKDVLKSIKMEVDDDVVAYVSVDDFLKILNAASELKDCDK